MIPKLTRRSAVAMATAGLVAGCSRGAARAGTPQPARAPGAAQQDRAVRDSAALLARYDAVAAAHPSLAARLAPLRAETARHVRAFGGSPAPAGGKPPGGVPAVPASQAKALAALAAAERSLADRRADALLEVPGDLARLLASVAASGAGHVVLLGAAARP